MDEEKVTLDWLIDRFDLDPEYAERELEYVRDMYLGEVKLRENWSTFTDRKKRYVSIKKKAASLGNLLRKEKDQLLFSDMVFAGVPEPDCTMDQLLAVLQRVQQYAETATDRRPIKNRREAKCGDYLLHRLTEAWENLTGKPATKGTKGGFYDFIDYSCEYLGIDSKGMWKKHKG